MKVALCFIITSTEKKNETKTYYTFGHLKRRFSKPCNSLIFVFLFYFSHILHQNVLLINPLMICLE